MKITHDFFYYFLGKIEMSNTLYRIIGFYYDIPSSGKENHQLNINTYRKAYQCLVDGLLRGVISLLVSFMDPAKAPPSTSSSPFMLSTAALWETCKSASSLPATNRQAVFNEWKALMETLTDAKNETDEMERSSSSDLGNGNAENDTTAFDDDMDLDVEVDAGVAKKCASLVGLTHLLFQKILKRCTLSDKLMTEGQAIVEQVDVMVSKAYDLDPEDMKPVMEEYVQKINSLIQVASTCGQENDAIWFKVSRKDYKQYLVVIMPNYPLDVCNKAFWHSRLKIAHSIYTFMTTGYLAPTNSYNLHSQ
jgi:hypothetical protein